MNGIHVLGDADTVLAFALGGLAGSVITTVSEARAVLTTAIDTVRTRGREGRRPLLLLVSRAVAALAADELHAMTLDPTAPLILIIPGYGERGGAVVDDFVERAIGVRL